MAGVTRGTREASSEVVCDGSGDSTPNNHQIAADNKLAAILYDDVLTKKNTKSAHKEKYKCCKAKQLVLLISVLTKKNTNAVDIFNINKVINQFKVLKVWKEKKLLRVWSLTRRMFV